MTFDVAAILTTITAGVAAIVTVAGAMLALVVGVKIWKRLRGAA